MFSLRFLSPFTTPMATLLRTLAAFLALSYVAASPPKMCGVYFDFRHTNEVRIGVAFTPFPARSASFMPISLGILWHDLLSQSLVACMWRRGPRVPPREEAGAGVAERPFLLQRIHIFLLRGRGTGLFSLTSHLYVSSPPATMVASPTTAR